MWMTYVCIVYWPYKIYRIHIWQSSKRARCRVTASFLIQAYCRDQLPAMLCSSGAQGHWWSKTPCSVAVFWDHTATILCSSGAERKKRKNLTSGIEWSVIQQWKRRLLSTYTLSQMYEMLVLKPVWVTSITKGPCCLLWRPWPFCIETGI